MFNLIAVSPSPPPAPAPVAPEASPSGMILTGDSVRCCLMMLLVAMALGGVAGRGTTLAMSSYRVKNLCMQNISDIQIKTEI